jgi:hypothetical protein
VPLSAIAGHLRELREQAEHIATRFLEFTTEHVFARYIGTHQPPTEDDAVEAAALVRRLRPLAQQTVDVELARAMRGFATRQLRRHLVPEAAEAVDKTCSVRIPASTMRAVEKLVGPARAAAFITAAAEREVQSRTLDALASNVPENNKLY